MTRTHRVLVRSAALALLLSSASACANTTTREYHAAGDGRLCDASGPALGVVAVLPETAWRADQKDPDERNSMAERAIVAAFDELSCGSLAPPGGIRALGRWSTRPERTLLGDLLGAGVDTAIFVRVEELTPHLTVTLSLPFLWSGSNEADFRVRALRTRDGRVEEDFRIRRVRTGLFHLRPASWSEPELRKGLEATLATERAP